MKYSSARKKTEYQGRNSSNKKQEKYMHNLTQELHQSRIAVEHIANFRKDEQMSSKNIQAVKNELHQCVIQINTQEKRQIVLRQLVSLLKGEMTKIQAKQMELKQKQEAELEKSIKQFRQDIDKISQKKNQQVAKIAILKQSANQSRSQRVVYSNLFKKLQTQLKQHQETYKNQLLKAEKTKLQLQLSPNKKNRNFKEDQNRHLGVLNGSYISKLDENPLNRVAGSQQKQCINLKFQKAFSSTKQQYDSNAMHLSSTKPHQDPSGMNTLKVHNQLSISRGKSAKATKVFRYNSSKQNIENCSGVMEELMKFIDRVKIATGCQTVQGLQALSKNIYSENENLLFQISHLNEQIQKFQNQSIDINKGLAEKHYGNQDHQYQQFEEEMLGSSAIFNVRNSTNSQKDGYYPITQGHNKNGKQNVQPNLKKVKQKHSRSTSSHPFSFWNEEGVENQANNISQFVELCEMLKIDLPTKKLSQDSVYSQEKVISELSNLQLKQKFKALDSIIEDIWHQINTNILENSHPGNEPDNSHSVEPTADFQNHHSPDKQLCQGLSGARGERRESSGQLHMILSRMDKFGNCEKILDREGFCGEYRRQINRKTRMRNKRN